ncbi:molybdopterin molybdotransferase MoeA [Haladaptatus halobius]|uniref:molybdopterin molybdotransferase MoeA n=1 Tax=Haladaptatus halobius TaxID=2884875 RepID=UPI001D0A3F2A|nr:molybdopterin molybdotransferase MoeA [Haladaptatus halobius]
MTDYDHDVMLWREAAVERVRSLRSSFFADCGVETISLDAISGRVLANDVQAPSDIPPHDRATMDGFAFDAADDYPLTILEGEVFPEDEPPALGSGKAIRIATGAPLPRRANVVLKREESNVEEGHLHGPSISPGTYVYERGSNVAAGETLFEAGERLSPKDAILLGDLGYESVSVHQRLSVGVAATGTEIHEGRLTDLDSSMLMGLIRSWGHEVTYEGTAPDEYERIDGLVDEMARKHDVVVTTGGTSVGHKDHVIRALNALGEVLFHRVRLRPGKPIAFARLPDHNAIAIAIPGKPVGAHTVATLITRPFFTGEATLPTIQATLTRDVGLGSADFEYAIPVALNGKEAMPLGHADSALAVYREAFNPSVLSSSTRATRADGIVLTTTALNAGETIDVVPYLAIE